MAENPFYFTGGKPEGDDFIGRTELLDDLKRRVAIDLKTGGTSHIVGLPRMGKTSLVNYCFISEPQFLWWIDHHQAITVYQDLSGQESAKYIWSGLSDKVCRRVNKWVRISNREHESISTIADKCRDIKHMSDATDRYNALIDILEQIKDDLKLSVIFVFDELDELLKNNFDSDSFRKLRALSQYGAVVTCSRRTPSFIEKEACGTEYFSNKGVLFWVGMFDSKEIASYWERYDPYFCHLTSEQFSRYKKLMDNYAGGQPDIMNYMNSEVFEHGDLTAWSNARNNNERERLERRFRIYVREKFERMMRNVEEQGLKQVAMQLVLGSRIPEEKEKIHLLLKYQFIRETSEKDKREIFGYDIGPTSTEGNGKYACFSEFTSHLMREENDYTLMSQMDLISTTELKLRELVRLYIRTALFGNRTENPFEVLDSRGSSYEERWMVEYLKDVNAQSFFDTMKGYRIKRIENSTRQPEDRDNPIDLISSSTLGQFWDAFISPKWNSYYGRVFDFGNWNPSLGYLGSGNRRIKDKWKHTFETLSIFRNADAHRNLLVDHTNDFIDNAEEECRKVCIAIDHWFDINMAIGRERMNSRHLEH